MYENYETPLGRPVESLQTMLREISRVDEAVPPVIPDGIYGDQTARSVVRFQEAKGLPATGVVDLDTWDAIVRAFDQALESIYPVCFAPRLLPKEAVLPGDSHFLLYIIQAMFAALATVLGGVPPVQVSGTHDEASVKAVKWLQRCAGMDEHGAVDIPTWSALARLSAALMPASNDGLPLTKNDDELYYPQEDGRMR
ncbi:MAG: peptidoglycan-binding domain-containing protein [Clostridia bacterium]|nr:peptidoglycan-binding domain-containing protein [Clostridia bacterium]